jgi:hypothetical protein
MAACLSPGRASTGRRRRRPATGRRRPDPQEMRRPQGGDAPATGSEAGHGEAACRPLGGRAVHGEAAAAAQPRGGDTDREARRSLNDLGAASRGGRDARDDLPLVSTSHILGVTGHGGRAGHGEMGRRPWEGTPWGDAGGGHGMAHRPWGDASGSHGRARRPWGAVAAAMGGRARHGELGRRPWEGAPAMGRWGRRPWVGAPSMGRGLPAMGRGSSALGREH